MTDSTLVIFEWDGAAMVPLPRFHNLCNAEFCVHERYRMEVREERSITSHNHFFAAVTEGWRNLGDDLAERFRTPEHLRKWALIKAGYYDERSIVAASKAEAQRIAAFLRPMDDYAVIAVREATVIVYTAKSQSMKAMGKKVFQESKDKVLDVIAGLIDLSADRLRREAGKAA